VVLRPAVAADAALIAELGARTFSETFAADNSPGDLEAYLRSAFSPDLQGAELADPRNRFFVLEAEGAAIGYAQLRAGATPPEVVGPRPIELARIYVVRARLGRGMGARLLDHVLAEARRGGAETVWLGVWEHNERALAFYRKRSFRLVGDHTFWVGSDPQRDLLMELVL
jgi:ribosomal protein S18 acetylase RimI-like enzyme